LEDDPEAIKVDALPSTGNGTPQDLMNLNLGVKVLRQMPDYGIADYLLNWYLANLAEIGFLHKPSTKLSLDSFWSTYGELLLARKVEGLEMIATSITRNGKRVLIHPDDATEWNAHFSGENMRWETIGLLFVGFGLAALSIPEQELSMLYGGKAIDRNKFMKDMKGCVEVCVDLCRHSLNGLVCNLQYKNLIFESVLKGDSSKS